VNDQWADRAGGMLRAADLHFLVGGSGNGGLFQAHQHHIPDTATRTGAPGPGRNGSIRWGRHVGPAW
jgi:hypothetical protein